VRVSPPERPVQNWTVSENKKIAPIAVKATKLIMALIAARRLEIRNMKTTNSAGVSLIAAASPVSTPCGIHRRSPPEPLRAGASGSRSATTKAINIVFTWP
jgi:hypothetical protein